jgi:hypothetical protein
MLGTDDLQDKMLEMYEAYGDYGEIAITSGGKTIAIWGEGDSYTGPGGTWYNRQT